MQCIRMEGCAVQREVCSVSSLAPVKARHWFSSACTFVYHCTLKPNLITVIEVIGHCDTALLPTKKKAWIVFTGYLRYFSHFSYRPPPMFRNNNAAQLGGNGLQACFFVPGPSPYLWAGQARGTTKAAAAPRPAK